LGEFAIDGFLNLCKVDSLAEASGGIIVIINSFSVVFYGLVFERQLAECLLSVIMLNDGMEKKGN